MLTVIIKKTRMVLAVILFFNITFFFVNSLINFQC